MEKRPCKERAEMGVIGRLDDQVNEIIIKPVGKRNAPESEAPKAPDRESRPQPQPVVKEDRARDEENRKAPSTELPVWLL
jgi:hypothetical protein